MFPLLSSSNWRWRDRIASKASFSIPSKEEHQLSPFGQASVNQKTTKQNQCKVKSAFFTTTVGLFWNDRQQWKSSEPILHLPILPLLELVVDESPLWSSRPEEARWDTPGEVAEEDGLDWPPPLLDTWTPWAKRKMSSRCADIRDKHLVVTLLTQPSIPLPVIFYYRTNGVALIGFKIVKYFTKTPRPQSQMRGTPLS